MSERMWRVGRSPGNTFLVRAETPAEVMPKVYALIDRRFPPPLSDAQASEWYRCRLDVTQSRMSEVIFSSEGVADIG